MISKFINKHLVLTIFLSLCLLYCEASHFRGAIIMWRPTGLHNEVKITFRIAWRRSFNQATYCDESHVTSGEFIGIPGDLKCISGCFGSLMNMTYQCTDFSIDEDWSAGEKSTTVKFQDNDDNNFYQFGYNGGDWITLIRGGGSWELRSTANLTLRQDIERINSSPVSAMPPIVRLQYGCNHTVEIPVTDADGDKIRCRWAESAKGECGGVCEAFVGADIDEDTCTISYIANGAIGWYAVAVQIEDFMSQNDITALSSVPLQFLVQVFQSNEPCSSKPTFVGVTPQDGSCIAVPLNTIYRATIVANVTSPLDRIREINTVSPVGMVKSTVELYGNTGSAWYINITWSPTESQIGSHIFCFSAVNTARLSSDQRCVTLVVGDESRSGLNPPRIIADGLQPTGTIYPDHSTWYIEFDQQIIKSTVPAFIYFYKEDWTIYDKIDVSTSKYVTLSQEENRLYFVTNFTLQEKRNYYINIDPGIVRGILYCGVASEGLPQTRIWKVKTRCRKGYWGDLCNNLCVCSQTNTLDCDEDAGVCHCSEGWSGVDCDTDLNECSKVPNPCPANSECVNTVGSYNCIPCRGRYNLLSGKCIKDLYLST